MTAPVVGRGVADLVDDARFSLRLRGYDPVEVDDLLDAVAVLATALDARMATAAVASVPGSIPDIELVELLSDLPSRTFRQARRGDDPVQVKALLRRVEAAVAALALEPPATVHDPVALAEGRAAAILAGARAEADRIGRQVLAEVPADRWLDRSGAAGTVIQRARQEAEDVRRHARVQAAKALATAEQERAGAAQVRAESEAEAAAVLARARDEMAPVDAATVVGEVLQAGAHRLAAIEAETMVARNELAAVRATVVAALSVPVGIAG